MQEVVEIQSEIQCETFPETGMSAGADCIKQEGFVEI